MTSPVVEAQRKKFRRIPFLRRWHRMEIYLRFEIFVNQVFNSGSATNKKATEGGLKYLAAAVPDETLRARLTPDYPIGCTRILGHNGVSIRRRWAKGAEAYLGITVADFPNLFMLYGPNTNLGHNSILFMIEQQIRYTVGVLEGMRAQQLSAVSVTRHEQDKFNRRIQQRMTKRVWVNDCSSWYKNESGKVVNNWPGSTVDYWWKCRRANLNLYETS